MTARAITRILFTGTGRCGTKWISYLLNRSGIECGHERAFNVENHGEGEWVAESSWPAAPYLDNVGPETYLVHVVRHPLSTIASRAAWGTFDKDERPHPKRRAFITEHCPEVELGRTPVEKAALHWVAWNELIERRHADELVRVEEIRATDVSRWAEKLGHTPNDFAMPAHANRAKPGTLRPVYWHDVDYVPGLVEAARRYGY